jgi:uncharacterized protein (UPF0332 family)
MPAYDQELMAAARDFLGPAGKKGKPPSARIRRSISTCYYALFHFLLNEVAVRTIGSHGALLRRRRIFARSLSHAGIKVALDKVKGRRIDPSVEEFLCEDGIALGPVEPPPFAQSMAKAFLDAQAKRHDADYDLNKWLSKRDAELLVTRVERAIDEWRRASTRADKDFKHALCVLMVLKGSLRREN